MATTRATPASIVALRFDGAALWVIDQTQLPWHDRELELRTAEDVAEAIRRLAIRGAPLIGVAGAYGVVLELARRPLGGGLDRARHVLRGARPTAVNLSAAIDRVCRQASAAGDRPARGRAQRGARDRSRGGGRQQRHRGPRSRPPRHARGGSSPTATPARSRRPGRGTALAVVAEKAQRGTLDSVLATESRPLLQGARLTTYELPRLNIPHELIVDSAAAGLIAGGAVDAVIVGCDRVAANGDVANKVGTYGLALAARAADIPFVVAGPTSTIDPNTPDGAHIAIEERDPDEVEPPRAGSSRSPELLAGTPPSTSPRRR